MVRGEPETEKPVSCRPSLRGLLGWPGSFLEYLSTIVFVFLIAADVQ